SPAAGRHPAPAAATGPSVGGPAALWPASAARSARARRTSRTTSKSACPPPHRSPRGPRRAQAPLSGLLPDADFEMRLPERLGQLRDLRLELLLPRRR